VLQIVKVFPVSKSMLQLNRLSVQQQVGIQDCGLFSIAFEVCNGNNIEKTEEGTFMNVLRKENYLLFPGNQDYDHLNNPYIKLKE